MKPTPLALFAAALNHPLVTVVWLHAIAVNRILPLWPDPIPLFVPFDTCAFAPSIRPLGHGTRHFALPVWLPNFWIDIIAGQFTREIVDPLKRCGALGS